MKFLDLFTFAVRSLRGLFLKDSRNSPALGISHATERVMLIMPTRNRILPPKDATRRVVGS